MDDTINAVHLLIARTDAHKAHRRYRMAVIGRSNARKLLAAWVRCKALVAALEARHG